MFAETLRRLRKEKGLTQKQLAELLYIDCSTVTKWETKKSYPDYEKQQKLAELFNVSIDFLRGRSHQEKETKGIKIPILGSIPAGIPFEAIEDIVGEEEIPSAWLAGDKEYFALKIKGDSMYPKYLSGDIVVFEKCETCETGEDCAVMVNGYDATFKKIERMEMGIILKPLNPEYESTFYSNDDIINLPIRIIGRAKEIRRKV